MQLINIKLISLTLEVLNFDKSIDINFEHPQNKFFIFSIEEVFIFPKLIFSKFLQSLNIIPKVLTWEASK